MEPFELAMFEENLSKREAQIKFALKLYPDWTRKMAEDSIRKALSDPVWMNDLYQVVVRDLGDWVHLSIKRIDKEPIHDWRELQEIKNLLVGPENEALELYPAESRRVDTANQYHLWVIKDPASRLPVGFNARLVLDADDVGDYRSQAKGSIDQNEN